MRGKRLTSGIDSKFRNAFYGDKNMTSRKPTAEDLLPAAVDARAETQTRRQAHEALRRRNTQHVVDAALRALAVKIKEAVARRQDWTDLVMAVSDIAVDPQTLVDCNLLDAETAIVVALRQKGYAVEGKECYAEERRALHVSWKPAKEEEKT